MKYRRVNVVFQDMRNMVKIVVPGGSFAAAVAHILNSNHHIAPNVFIAEVSGRDNENVAINIPAITHIEDCGPANEKSFE